MKHEEKLLRPAGGFFAGGGVLTGLAALIGSSCCVLPVLLAQAGVGAALAARLDILAKAKPFLLALTALFILAGFAAAFWNGRRPRPRVLVLLVAAVVLIAGAYAMPFYEEHLLDLIRG